MKMGIKELLKVVKEKYMSYITLLFGIIILLVSCMYSNKSVEYDLYYGGKLVIAKFQEKIINKSNNRYMYIEDLTKFFSEDFYYDKISGKLIVTSRDGVEKISRNDKDYFLTENSKLFVNLDQLMNLAGKNMVVQNGNIYIDDFNYIEGVVNKNRVEVFNDGKIICFLNKGDIIKIRVDDNLKNNTGVLNIIKLDNNDSRYGKILRSNSDFEYAPSITGIKNKIIMAKIEGTSYNKNIEMADYISVNMLRLSSADKVYELDYVVPTANTNIVASINNGYNMANYDADIVSAMLHSEQNRQAVITTLVDFTNNNNLAGVAIDFAKFKNSDKDYFTQFIKELCAVMHSNNKIVVVNVQSTNYIDMESISRVADFVVLQAYYERTTASKTSGPISSLSYVEKALDDLLKTNTKLEKVILEIPAYTILWTERQGTVIAADVYDMNLSKEYIKRNDIEFKLDNRINQNYISYTKGITTYKMWLEDEYSVAQRVNLANKYNLAGVSLYKSGMELDGIYDIISSNLNK